MERRVDGLYGRVAAVHPCDGRHRLPRPRHRIAPRPRDTSSTWVPARTSSYEAELKPPARLGTQHAVSFEVIRP
jgi:hypothetical protein